MYPSKCKDIKIVQIEPIRGNILNIKWESQFLVSTIKAITKENSASTNPT